MTSPDLQFQLQGRPLTVQDAGRTSFINKPWVLVSAYELDSTLPGVVSKDHALLLLSYKENPSLKTCALPIKTLVDADILQTHSKTLNVFAIGRTYHFVPISGGLTVQKVEE